jgi:hypothetical protein
MPPATSLAISKATQGPMNVSRNAAREEGDAPAQQGVRGSARNDSEGAKSVLGQGWRGRDNNRYSFWFVSEAGNCRAYAQTNGATA